MATKQLVDNFLNTIVDTVQIAFSAPSDKDVVIDVFTVTNNSVVNASYKAYIKTVSGELIPIRPFKIVVWGEIDLGSGITGQVIPKGGELLFETSALDSIYFTVSGNSVGS